MAAKKGRSDDLDHPELFGPAGEAPAASAAPPASEAAHGLPFVLERPLAFFDLETTGLDPEKDRIVEISVVKLLPDGSRQAFDSRVKPGIPIPPESSKIHGIREEDVAFSPSFAELASGLASFLEGCDLGGFGVARFDLMMLGSEFKRAGLPFDPSGRRVIDAQMIFHRREKRDLTAALQFYCGRILEGAHGAKADCEASVDVFIAQFSRYPDLPRGIGPLHEQLNKADERHVDPQGRLTWRHGKACINFGKHKSKTLEEVAKTDPGYLRWLLDDGKSPPELQKIYKEALQGRFPQKA